jgi:hypothetical protein
VNYWDAKERKLTERELARQRGQERLIWFATGLMWVVIATLLMVTA